MVNYLALMEKVSSITQVIGINGKKNVLEKKSKKEHIILKMTFV